MKNKKNQKISKSMETKKNIFTPIENNKQEQEKIAGKWGNERVDESNKRWNSMTKEEQKAILQECSDIFEGLAKYTDKGADCEEVTELMIRWHHFIKNFYEPSLEVLRGLGLMYVYDPGFSEKFSEIDPALPNFLEKAINNYVDILEEKWLESQYNILEH